MDIGQWLTSGRAGASAKTNMVNAPEVLNLDFLRKVRRFDLPKMFFLCIYCQKAFFVKKFFFAKNDASGDSMGVSCLE